MKQLKNSIQYSDEEIITRVLEGNKPMYELIIRRYNSYLYKTGRSYGFNHHTTEDLMQECYINAFRALHTFQSRSSFKTWLVRIMLNLCFKKKQKEKAVNVVLGESLSEEYMHKSIEKMTSVASDHRAINKELGLIIEEALMKIPDEYRIVFTLRTLNGLSTREVAQLLELSESNVKVRLNRSKALLRKEVEKKYTSEDIFEFNLIYCDKMVARVISVI